MLREFLFRFFFKMERFFLFFSFLLFNFHACIKLFLLFFSQCSVLSNFSFFCNWYWFLVVKISHKFLPVSLFHMSLLDLPVNTNIFGQFNLLNDLWNGKLKEIYFVENLNLITYINAYEIEMIFLFGQIKIRSEIFLQFILTGRNSISPELNITVVDDGCISHYFSQFCFCLWWEIQDLNNQREFFLPSIFRDGFWQGISEIFDLACSPGKVFHSLLNVTLGCSFQKFGD